MSEDNKTNTCECPICGKQISSLPGPKAIHIERCKKEVAKVETPKIDLSNIKNDEIRRTMEKAIALQKAMLEAPEVVTAEISEDVNLNLVKRYAPNAVTKYSDNGKRLNTHTAYFGDAKEQSVDIAKGFVPVLNENGEYVVNMGGDILYTRPREITDAIERSFQMESRARVASVTKQAQIRSSVKNIDAPNYRDGEIKEEEYGEVATLTLKPGEV